jgi:DME family drug/metabolite transporter
VDCSPCWHSSPAGFRAAGRPTCSRSRAPVAVYQLAFFQAVADTGVAVGAIVAIGSGPIFAGMLERVLDGS